MELTPQKSKRLHHHAIPIGIISLAVLVATIALLASANNASSGGLALVHDLTTRPLHVSTTTNGLAHVSVANPSRHISPELEQAGRTTQLVLSLHAAQP